MISLNVGGIKYEKIHYYYRDLDIGFILNNNKKIGVKKWKKCFQNG